jgi:hypothetical protein
LKPRLKRLHNELLTTQSVQKARLCPGFFVPAIYACVACLRVWRGHWLK